MIYEPCQPGGAGHNECVGYDDPSATAGGPCACTCHLGVVVVHDVDLTAVSRPGSLGRDMLRMASGWLAHAARNYADGHANGDVLDHVRMAKRQTDAALSQLERPGHRREEAKS